MVLQDGEHLFAVYSKRFTLTDMTGSFSPTVSAALESISTTDGPPSSDRLGKRQADPAAVPALHDVPYPDQTGSIRYAPMAKQPGTKISLDSAEPQFPTSEHTIATTFLPTPAIETTISVAAPKTVISMENTVSFTCGTKKACIITNDEVLGGSCT
jgi:hypothetical protein